MTTAVIVCCVLAIVVVVACTVTVINVQPPKRCDQEMSIEVLGGVVLRACESELDPDGKLTP